MRTEGVAALALGVAGLIITAGTGGWKLSNTASVLFFQLNPPHSALLTAVGVVTIIAAQRHRWLLSWALIELLLTLVIFLYGTGQSAGQRNTNVLRIGPQEDFLYAGLTILSFIILVGAAAVPWWARHRSDRVIGASGTNGENAHWL